MRRSSPVLVPVASLFAFQELIFLVLEDIVLDLRRTSDLEVYKNISARQMLHMLMEIAAEPQGLCLIKDDEFRGPMHWHLMRSGDKA